MRRQDTVVDEHVHIAPRRQRGQLLQELGGLEQDGGVGLAGRAVDGALV